MRFVVDILFTWFECSLPRPPALFVPISLYCQAKSEPAVWKWDIDYVLTTGAPNRRFSTKRCTYSAASTGGALGQFLRHPSDRGTAFRGRRNVRLEICDAYGSTSSGRVIRIRHDEVWQQAPWPSSLWWKSWLSPPAR